MREKEGGTGHEFGASKRKADAMSMNPEPDRLCNLGVVGIEIQVVGKVLETVVGHDESVHLHRKLYGVAVVIFLDAWHKIRES